MHQMDTDQNTSRDHDHGHDRDHHCHHHGMHDTCCWPSGYGGRFYLLRWLLGLLILLLVFLVGLRLGEFRGTYGDEYFSRHMRYNQMMGRDKDYFNMMLPPQTTTQSPAQK